MFSQNQHTKSDNLLGEYKIFSFLGIPFFAVKSEEERQELQVIVKFRLREVKDLTLIPEPDLSHLEEYFTEIENNLKKSKKWSLSRLKYIFLGGSMLFFFVIKHFVVRIGFKKQICEEEIKMFAETASEAIEYGREKRIKKLAGIS